MISLEDFEKIDMRVGTIIDVCINKGAKKPAYKLRIDLGDIGVKESSPQITELYQPEDLIGKSIVLVVNFPSIRISEVKSEVRILGALTSNCCSLLTVDKHAKNGDKIA